MHGKIKRALVIGTGMMGPGIALTLARGGLEVKLAARTFASVQRGMDSFRANLKILRDNDLITKSEAAGIEKRVSGTSEIFEDLWWNDLPWVHGIKIGNFTPAFSLESVTSARDIVFMEPALPVSAFGPARSVGVELGGPVLNERVTWALGFARTLGSPDEGDRSQGPGRGFSRVTWLVQDDRQAVRLWHLGASMSLLFAADAVQYQTRPESHLAPYLLDTGTLPAAGQSTSGGFELVHIRGPWLFMIEALAASIRGDGSASFWGCYAVASRSLTGDPAGGAWDLLPPEPSYMRPGVASGMMSRLPIPEKTLRPFASLLCPAK